jgi:hypothetical protein
MKAPLIIHGANATSWTKTSVPGKLNCWRVTRSMDETAHPDVVTGKDGTIVEEKPALLRPVSRLRLPQRLIAHLINDTEEKEISEEQHIQIGQMESDDSNQYVQNLLLAASNVPDIKELSAHVEWNLVSAIKQVFQRDRLYRQFIRRVYDRMGQRA